MDIDMMASVIINLLITHARQERTYFRRGRPDGNSGTGRRQRYPLQRRLERLHSPFTQLISHTAGRLAGVVSDSHFVN